jgi:hypothetical protein
MKTPSKPNPNNRPNGEQVAHKKLQMANQFLKNADLTIVFDSMKTKSQN